MFNPQQINEFQSKVQQALKDVQKTTVARAKDLENEARKVLESLTDRAQADLRVWIQQAEGASRGQVAALGVELEKLGRKLQELNRKGPESIQ